MTRKVLLVEDDQFKAKALSFFFTTEFLNFEVIEARSLTSGYRMLEQINDIELLLLDMSLPTFDVGPMDSGGEPLGFGGLKLLDLLEESEIKIPTIVVTQFQQFGEGENAINVSDLELDLQKSFPDYFIGLVHYNSAQSDWKNSLRSLAIKFLGAKF
jgi:CheY-like chemotaxis protein